MSERYIASIEISSSKIIAAVGKTRGDGNLDIIAIEQETDIEGIRYGIIKNLEETSMAVSRIFSRLEQRSAISPRKIKSVVVGLAGLSLHNMEVETDLHLPEDTEITDEILKRLKDQAIRAADDTSLEVVDAVARNYKVGKTETTSPKGMVGNSITAIYDLIVCQPELKRNIKRTIEDKLHTEVSGFVVTAMATAHLILTTDEKRLGCMLVDFGAETTTVSIYKGGALRYYATLPMGGRNITRDITSLGVLDDHAEEIKRTSGNAIADPKISSLLINGIKQADISNLVVARCEEIVANVIEQIEYAGLKDSDLGAGIICIGGGARMQGLCDLLAQESDLTVRKGKLPQYVKIEDQKAGNMELIQVGSVLYAGATLSNVENLEMPKQEEMPPNGVLDFGDDKPEPPKPQKPKKGRDFFKKLGDRMAGFFGNPDEDDSDLL